MKMILGRKLHMTQIHTDNDMVIPVTVVQAGPCVIAQVKTKEHDGYDALQLCFGQKKKAHKPEKGHVAGLSGIAQGRGAAFIKELRTQTPLAHAARGAVITVASFAPGDQVSVTGCSKGRGFAGVVKRHHFHGHPKTHGHKDQERMPGSIGSGGVQHVFKGQRMAGRMGNVQVTLHGLEVIAVDADRDQLLIKGAVPGSRNGFLAVCARDGEMVFEKMNQESGMMNQGEERTELPPLEQISEPAPEPATNASSEEMLDEELIDNSPNSPNS